MSTVRLPALGPPVTAIARQYVLAGFAPRMRGQVAIARALLDELDHVVPGSEVEHGLADQLVEELARLGCQLLESAAALGKAVEEAEPKGS